MRTTKKVGRDSATGRFVTREETRRRPETTTLENVNIETKPPYKPPRLTRCSEGAICGRRDAVKLGML